MGDARVITSVEDIARAEAAAGGVWGYCRVSSDKQEDGQSFDVQQADITRYCASVGLERPFFVIETGSAGKPMIPVNLPGQVVAQEIAPRPLLVALLTKLIDRPLGGSHLIIWKLDRLSRIATEQDMLLSMLRKRNVQVHSTMAGEQDLLDWSKDPNDPVRKLMRAVLGGLAEYERAMIRMRTAAGARMKAAKGGWLGGRTPFGYQAENKDLVIDPAAAEVVKKIFYWRESCGDVMPTIAARLGATWSRVRVRRILLLKQLYLGIYTDPYGVPHQRPDLRILPENWDATLNELGFTDIAQGLGYVKT